MTMKAELQTLCDLFIANRDIARQAFKWDSDAVHPLCANIFCARGMTMEMDRLEQCKEIIKNQTGILSNFRGSLRPALAAMLAIGERPEEKMSRALENYRILKQDFWGSEYLALVAFLLTDIAPVSQAEEKAGRGKAIYQRMKKEHPFLTSSEDSVFAVMMAFSEKLDDALIEDMEACYQGLKQKFSIGDSVQTASHVLAMAPGTPEEKVDRVISLYEALRNAGVKYGRYYELATLAALAVMDVDLPKVTAEIQEVDELLSRSRQRRSRHARGHDRIRSVRPAGSGGYRRHGRHLSHDHCPANGHDRRDGGYDGLYCRVQQPLMGLFQTKRTA